MRFVGISVLFFLVLGCSKYEQDPNDQRKFLVCDKKTEGIDDGYYIELDYEGERLVDGHLTVVERWLPIVEDDREPWRIETMSLSERRSTEFCLFFKRGVGNYLALDRRNLQMGQGKLVRSGSEDCFWPTRNWCELTTFARYQGMMDTLKIRHQRFNKKREIYWSESETRKREIQKNRRQI